MINYFFYKNSILPVTNIEYKSVFFLNVNLALTCIIHNILCCYVTSTGPTSTFLLSSSDSSSIWSLFASRAYFPRSFLKFPVVVFVKSSNVSGKVLFNVSSRKRFSIPDEKLSRPKTVNCNAGDTESLKRKNHTYLLSNMLEKREHLRGKNSPTSSQMGLIFHLILRKTSKAQVQTIVVL